MYSLYLSDFAPHTGETTEAALIVEGDTITGCFNPKFSPPLRMASRDKLLMCRPIPATGNVSGSSQAACRDFPGVSPVLPDTPTADGEPGALVVAPALPRESYVVRQEDVYYQVRWLLMSDESPIKKQVDDVCEGMQAHDRDDMRQDLCIAHWRRAVAAEYRGIRKYSVGKWLIGDVRRWVGRHVGKNDTTANPDPLTAEELRTKSLQSRSATIDKEIHNEMTAALAALAKAKPPAPVVSFSW